jgi:hypothetical protein
VTHVAEAISTGAAGFLPSSLLGVGQGLFNHGLVLDTDYFYGA